jgi:dihydroorotate dehydrogenase electron transfer subunit
MLTDVTAEVISNTRLSSSYNVIALAAPEIAAITAPGQFVMVKPARGIDPILRRPFSVFEVLRDKGGRAIGLSLLNKRVGVGTGLLYEAQPGDRVGCLGPLGRPFVPVDPPSEAWMIAGGVGLAPFATLADALVARKTPMTLFYGARSAADLYYADRFEQMGARLVLTTEDGTRGEAGRVTGPLERALSARAADQPVTIYACGPTPMMRAVASLGARFHRPVFVSLEPVMGCGMGGCYSCVVKAFRDSGASSSSAPRTTHDAPRTAHFVRSCLEGPVFNAAALDWNALPDGH